MASDTGEAHYHRKTSAHAHTRQHTPSATGKKKEYSRIVSFIKIVVMIKLFGLSDIFIIQYAIKNVHDADPHI